MTIDDFRRIALSMPEAEELTGLGYPNFCAGRNSFATIEDSTAVLRLTRDQQATLVAMAPEMFAPASSGWGRLGRTIVRLGSGDEAILRDAVAAAWRNVAHAAAGTSKIANAFQVSNAAVVVNGAAVGAGKVADVHGPVDEVKVERRDDLRDVIERLRVYWGQGPTR